MCVCVSECEYVCVFFLNLCADGAEHCNAPVAAVMLHDDCFVYISSSRTIISSEVMRVSRPPSIRRESPSGVLFILVLHCTDNS